MSIEDENAEGSPDASGSKGRFLPSIGDVLRMRPGTEMASTQPLPTSPWPASQDGTR
jgi:hypothetical protein